VLPQKGWHSPAFPEYRVDLSRFANREVAFSIRTLLRGRVQMNPFDMIGFAAIWQDPRIELREGGM
jgi:hypothetical protein